MIQRRPSSSSSAMGFSCFRLFYLLLPLLAVVCCVSERQQTTSQRRIRRPGRRKQQRQAQEQQGQEEQEHTNNIANNDVHHNNDNMMNTALARTTSIQILEYPSVFTINLPRTLSTELQELISELDLLDVECYNSNKHNNNDVMKNHTTTATSSSSSLSSYCKITTLLHSQRELDYFQSTFDSLKATTRTTTHSSKVKLFVLEYDDDITNAIVTKEKRMMMNGLHTTTEQQQERSNNNSGRDLQNYNTIYGHTCFLEMNSMINWIEDFVNTAPSYLDVSFNKIGETYTKNLDSNEGYDIHAFTLTASVSPIPYDDRSPILILTGVHAREYSPPELMRRWVESFVTPNDNVRRTILESTVIHWIPYVNPDGRALAETSQPFRRKNVNPTNIESEFCLEDEFGVDLNRNFPFRWGLASGSSSRGCIQTFRGETQASEPETQAVVNYAKSIFPVSQRKVVDDFELGGDGYDETTTTGVFIDIHSYGNYYIYPWGYENRQTPNDDAYQTMVSKIAHFTGYDSRGPGRDYTSPASGATDDFAYGELGAAGMTFEIGDSFHQNCEIFDWTVVPINIDALNYAASISFRPYEMSQGPDITSLAVQPTSLQFGDDIQVTLRASDTALTLLNAASQYVDEVRMYLDQHPLSTSTTVSPDYVFDSSVISGTGEITVTLTKDIPVGTHTLYAQAMGSGFHSGPVASVTFAVEPGSTTQPGRTTTPTAPPTNAPTNPGRK